MGTGHSSGLCPLSLPPDGVLLEGPVIRQMLGTPQMVSECGLKERSTTMMPEPFIPAPGPVPAPEVTSSLHAAQQALLSSTQPHPVPTVPGAQPSPFPQGLRIHTGCSHSRPCSMHPCLQGDQAQGSDGAEQLQSGSPVGVTNICTGTGRTSRRAAKLMCVGRGQGSLSEHKVLDSPKRKEGKCLLGKRK